jgi:uncharacterized membrane protein
MRTVTVSTAGTSVASARRYTAEWGNGQWISIARTMPPFAVSSYEISLVVHITAVVVGLGSTFAESIAFPVAMKLDPRHLPYVHRLQLAINQYFATPALVVILLTGMYQVSDADFEFGDVWISGSFAIVIILGGLLGGYFIPADRRLGPMVQRDIERAGGGPVVLSDEYQRRARTEGVVGMVAGLLTVVAIYLMVTKPGL